MVVLSPHEGQKQQKWSKATQIMMSGVRNIVLHVLLGTYVVWWVVGVRGRKRSSVIEQLHQVSPDFGEKGKAQNHKNGEEMPQTVINTLVDCYFLPF
jgi:hypothetical protein